MDASRPAGPGPSARQRVERAWHLHDGGRYELALQECLAALAVDPEFHEAHGLMAFCLALRSHLDDALEAARECVRLRPADSWPHYVHGWVLRRLRKYGEADVALREATRLSPAWATYREEHGWVLVNAGLHRAALEVIREGRKLDPQHAGLAAVEGVALHELNRFDEAEAAYRAALSLDPVRDVAHAGIGHLALRRHGGAEAERAFTEALRHAPNYRWAESGMADALRLQFPGYRRLELMESWIRRRTPEQRTALVAAGIALWCAMMILAPLLSSPGSAEPSVLSVALLGLSWLLPYAWAFAFWCLRRVYELRLRFHPVGRWLVDRKRSREAALIAGLLGAGAVLAIVGAAASWRYGIYAGACCLLGAPCVGAQMRVPSPPRWGGERLYLASCLAVGLCPGSVGELPFAAFGMAFLWFFVLYSVYLSLSGT